MALQTSLNLLWIFVLFYVDEVILGGGGEVSYTGLQCLQVLGMNFVLGSK